MQAQMQRTGVQWSNDRGLCGVQCDGCKALVIQGSQTHCRLLVAVPHLIMSSMKPMALAAREPRGPAEMTLTRAWNLRPAS